MAGPELLGHGPDRDAASFDEQVRRAAAVARRRRRAGLAGGALVAVAAAMLAGRSLPDPEPPPVAPRPTIVVPTPDRFVADIGVDSRWAYALVAACAGPGTTRQCTYRLLRRSLAAGGWTTTAFEARLVAGATGPARLFVPGDGRVTVVDQPTVGTVQASTDAGETVTWHVLSSGPPVAAVPAGAVVDPGLCACPGALTVLEPDTGRLRSLATPLRPTLGIRAVTDSGGVLWVLGDGGSRLVSAVSTDRGRSWRELLVGGARSPAEIVRLFPDGGRGAYLLVGRDASPDVLHEFSELWHVGDPRRPGAAWREVTPVVRPRSATSALADDRGLIISEDSGQLWRLRADGTMLQLPRPDLAGVPLTAGRLVAGRGGVLLGTVANESDLGTPTVLLSYDEGETWLVERIPV